MRSGNTWKLKARTSIVVATVLCPLDFTVFLLVVTMGIYCFERRWWGLPRNSSFEPSYYNFSALSPLEADLHRGISYTVDASKIIIIPDPHLASRIYPLPDIKCGNEVILGDSCGVELHLQKTTVWNRSGNEWNPYVKNCLYRPQ